MSAAHVEYLLRRGDDALILGQRLSEWCGHSPFLEEDIAMANTALDHVGRARMLLTHAGSIEGRGRDEDALAYLRGEREFRNALICELPIGDYGFTLMRQYLLDAFHFHLFDALRTSQDAGLAAIAAKAVKESAYHVRRSADWIVRLGDGTEESHARVQAALDELWGYTGELFVTDEIEAAMTAQGIAPPLADIERVWRADVQALLSRATLTRPSGERKITGGRAGLHTEYLGHLLAEMQIVQRSYPGLAW
jgi:ring-1,2-phenylacetyl-CoA epoxidase subunit PaaC